MKKLIFLLIVFFQFAQAIERDSLQIYSPLNKKYTLAKKIKCDGCGSAASGSMGFASMLHSNFVGIRYFNQQYKSSDGLYSNSVWYKENFSTTQVWARIPVIKKWQISVLIPYHQHVRETVAGNQNISGIGDITILSMYTVFDIKKDSTNIFSQTLQIGGGIKAASGKFDQANSGSINPSFQLGTGSWDYILGTEYNIKHNQIGLNTMFNYIFKTENDKKYRFGNQVNYAATLFYLLEKNKFSVAPQLGLAGEIYENNYQYSQPVRKSSGAILFSRFGFEIGLNKFSFGANAMLPMNQNLADNRVKADYRWSVNFNYSL